MFICEKCMADTAAIHYAIPDQVAPGKQSRWNLCENCMAGIWSELKLNHPTSLSYMGARFSAPTHHGEIREPGEMA